MYVVFRYSYLPRLPSLHGNTGRLTVSTCALSHAIGIEAAGLMKKKKRIRRESLRHFYGNSVNSPNLTEVPSGVIKVRRSPRLAGKSSSHLKEQGGWMCTGT